MKKILLTSVLVLAAAPALADAILMTARVDGTLVSTSNSANGTLSIVNQSFGPDFNLNSLDISSSTFLAPPDVLKTNTLDVNQLVASPHELVLDILATGLSGPNAVENFLSTFSVTGMEPGWSAREQTFISGTPLADTGVFTQASDSAFSTNPAFAGGTFNAEVKYTIDAIGLGGFNGGIDISVAAVPGPVLGAGIPGLLALGLLGIWTLRRSHPTA